MKLRPVALTSTAEFVEHVCAQSTCAGLMTAKTFALCHNGPAPEDADLRLRALRKAAQRLGLTSYDCHDWYRRFADEYRADPATFLEKALRPEGKDGSPGH